jgi:hypothetical protein
MIERQVHPAGLDRSGDGECIGERFAGDESTREARGATHSDPRREALQQAAAGEQVEERL